MRLRQPPSDPYRRGDSPVMLPRKPAYVAAEAAAAAKIVAAIDVCVNKIHERKRKEETTTTTTTTTKSICALRVIIMWLL